MVVRQIKYPHVHVQLTGQNGNVFNLMTLVRRALLDGGVSEEEARAFVTEVQSQKSYDDALAVMEQWVVVS